MDYMASLELAMRNERTEMEFYNNQAGRSRNPLARKMFETLAAEEKEHMTRISELHEKLVADGSWPADVPLQVGDTDVRRVLEQTAKLGQSSAEHDNDDLQALQRAQEFEARGSAFYAELAAAGGSEPEQEFFRFLSRIEKEHQLSIEDSLAYLQDPQGWMMQSERSGLDGA